MQDSRRCLAHAIYLSSMLSRRLFRSSRARFCADPCTLQGSANNELASRFSEQGTVHQDLFTGFKVWVGLGDSFSDCLCCALEFGARSFCTVAKFVCASFTS